MYLLVRELTGETERSAAAAFVAGLIFAFVPYRDRAGRAHPVAQLAVDAVRAVRLRRFVTLGARQPEPDSGIARSGSAAPPPC